MKIFETTEPVSKLPWKWPPFWFLVAVLGQFVLAWYDPLAITASPWWVSLWGYSLLVMGIALVLGSSKCFSRHGTCIIPFQKPSTLIQDGLYRFSRNPLYLGEVLMLMALAVLMGSVWALAPAIAFGVVITLFFIQPEGQLLRKQFGGEYIAYCGKVRRWL